MRMAKNWFSRSLLLVSGSLFFPLGYISVKYSLKKIGGKKLSEGDLCLISEKVMCVVQAVMATSVGFTVLCKVKDILHDSHWMISTYPWFSLPYFVYDSWAIYQTYYWNTPDPDFRGGYRMYAFMRQRWLILVHHLVIAPVLFPYIVFWRRGVGDFFLGALFLMELSVPFLSLQHVLTQFQLKNTRLYLINGLCTTVSFFCTRVLLLPYLYWRYSVYSGMALLQVPAGIPIKCNVGSAAVLLPQLFWFRQIVKRVVKHFRKTD